MADCSLALLSRMCGFSLLPSLHMFLGSELLLLSSAQPFFKSAAANDAVVIKPCQPALTGRNVHVGGPPPASTSVRGALQVNWAG